MFWGGGQEGIKDMGSLKVGREKAKKAGTQSEEDRSKGCQQNQAGLGDPSPHCSSAVKRDFKTVAELLPTAICPLQEDHNNVFVKYFELYKRQRLPNC